jgi:hypothetical protein
VLKWVTIAREKQSPDTPLSTVEQSFNLIPRSPRVGPQIESPVDALLLTHFLQSLPLLIYPNPDRSIAIIQHQTQLLYETDSVLLPAALTAAAANLATAGLVSQVDFLQRKQKALRHLSTSLQVSTQKNLGGSDWCRGAPPNVKDSAIAASVALATIQGIEGTSFAQSISMIRGSLTLLQMRSQSLWSASAKKASSSENPRQALDPFLGMQMKMMVYFDIMLCVPYPQPPLVDTSFWGTYVLPLVEQNSLANGRPDDVFGYCTDIFKLIGEAAVLINGFFGGALPLDTFQQDRQLILRKLEVACDELPEPHEILESNPPASTGSVQIRTHNSCIFAAIAHALATKIFLLRADFGACNDDLQPETRVISTQEKIEKLAQALSCAIDCVPIDTSAATILLWPLFVLGCEAVDSAEAQQRVEGLLRAMLAKENILNITICLDALKERIWVKKDAFRRIGWARHCWQEKIQMCLA